MAGLADFANSYFGTLGMAQQFQLGQQQKEMNALNLQRQYKQLETQQKVQGALERLHESYKNPVGSSGDETNEMLGRARMLDEEADMYRRLGGVDYEKQAKDASMEANRLRRSALAERKTDAEQFSDAVINVYDQTSLEGALDKLQGENPKLYRQVLQDAQRNGVNLTNYESAKPYLDARFAQAKTMTGRMSVQEKILKDREDAEMKREKQRIDNETKLARLDIQRRDLDIRMAGLDLREKERQIKEAAERRQREELGRKRLKDYADNVQRYEKDVQSLYSNLSTKEKTIRGLKLTPEEEVKKLTEVRSDYKRELDRVIGNAKGMGLSFTDKKIKRQPDAPSLPSGWSVTIK